MTGIYNDVWTPALVESLRKLWGECKTTRVIAERLGLTRGQVIGKAHRLKLAARANPVQRVTKPRVKKEPRPRKVHDKATAVRLAWRNGIRSAIAAHDSSLPKATRPLRELEGPVTNCRWPEGDPKEPGFHFCEAKTKPGRPYCHAHCLRAYQVVEEMPKLMAAE